ncbi:MAG: histidinol dehydrogenase [Desulfobulbaceae bacterium]|nr:histidinol dehydrogenase [Desulfobulbaceae bacterium]
MNEGEDERGCQSIWGEANAKEKIFAFDHVKGMVRKMIIRKLKVDSDQGREYIAGILDRFSFGDAGCSDAVAGIIRDVRDRGDEAVLEYTRKFDSPDMSVAGLRVTEEDMQRAQSRVDDDFKKSLRFAVERIRSFHEREMEDSWLLTRDDGTITGRLVRPVDSAGLYVPGGQGGSTPLVSSVLMNGIPAVIAGVAKLVMVTPANRQGQVSPALLVAAREIGITEIYKVGSAWAIAALAFGTVTIPRVDVIVGPGNQYVAEAKRQVMGRVRIDMIAGPSEVLIIADESANPAFIAADMLAQAEHDPQALPLLITDSEEIADRTVIELEKQLALLQRQDIARASLHNKGAVLVAESLDIALELANDIAIEHLELQVREPWQWLPGVRHAGAVFLGSYTPEAAGDYVAGPNHVLPTMGTAKISSALGVETFLKKSSIISYSRRALRNDAGHIRRLASLEGLTAHERSVSLRVDE